MLESFLFWLGVSLISIDAYFIFCHGGVPNIRTAPAIRARMIAALKADYEQKKSFPYIIIDAGSGNGLLTREIAKALPEAKVIGIEIAPQSTAWAKWLAQKNGLKNIEYRTMSFMDFDFSVADAVVMFLIPSVLGKLGEKIKAESRPNTLVISNKFRIGGGWKPESSERLKTFYLHQGWLHFYRKY